MSIFLKCVLDQVIELFLETLESCFTTGHSREGRELRIGHRVLAERESVSLSVLSDSVRSHGLKPARRFCPWNSPGQNTGVGICSLLCGSYWPRCSLVAQLVKNWPAMQKTWVWSLGWEDPLEKGKATQSMGSQRVWHDWVTFIFTFSSLLSDPPGNPCSGWGSNKYLCFEKCSGL